MNKQKYHNQIFNQQKSFFKLILFILLILPIITNFQVISLINGPSSEITQNSYLTSEYYILDNFFGKTSTLLKTLKLEANAVVSDSENNSYFTGVTELDVLHNTEIFVGKMNSSGSVLWINNWRHYEKNYANDLTIDEANNQLFIIGETVKNTSQSYSDILLSCINYTTGMEIWNTTIGDTSFSEQGKSIFYFENKLYIAAIQTKYFQIYSEPNIMLLCVNSTDGAIIWEQTFDNSYNDLYASLAFDALDEMFYLSFTRENRTTTPYQYNYFLQKFNLTGNLIWSRTADSYLSPRILDVKISPYNQQIYLVGDCYESISSSYKDGLIISYNSQGEILFTTTFGSHDKNEIVNTISFQNGNSYFIAGLGESGVRNKETALLAHFTTEGLDWFIKSNRFSYSNINDMICFPNGDFTMVGTCYYDYDFIYRRLLVCLSKDNDYDKLSDYWEPLLGTDPNEWDTDHDGYSDYDEYMSNTDPLDPKSFPKRRIFWRNFGLGFSVSIIGVFVIIQLGNYFIVDKQQIENTKKSLVFRIYNKLFHKRKTK